MWRRAGADDRVDAPRAIPRGVLGRTKEDVSRLGIGCAHFKRKHVGPQDVRKVLHTALDPGVNYLDVAPSYGDEKTGCAEEKMGPTIQDIRKRVFLVTKTHEPSREGTWRLLGATHSGRRMLSAISCFTWTSTRPV